MINISALSKCLSADLSVDYRGSHLDGRSTVNEAAFGLLQESFLKKFLVSSRTLPENDDAALLKFLQCNVHCESYTVGLNTSFIPEVCRFLHPWTKSGITGEMARERRSCPPTVRLTPNYGDQD
jgi:hypothetical protein